MPETDAVIIDRLTRSLDLFVPSAFGNGYSLLPSKPVRVDRRYSFTFRYWMVDASGKIRPLFVKIPHPSSMTTMQEAIASDRLRAEIKHEFEIMQAIASVVSRANHPGLIALNLGGVCPEFNAIVMEEIRLTMMKDYLVKWGILFGNPGDWEKFEKRLSLAGEWLRIIHDEFHKGRFVTLLDLRMGEMITSEFEALEKMSGFRLAKLRSLFFEVYNLCKTIRITISALHNDFHLGNIFVTEEERVGALDPNWKDEGPIFKDLSSLLIDPLTRKFQLVFFGLLFRPSLYRRFEKAVFRGYFGDQASPPRLLFFYCAFSVLVKWRMNEEVINYIRFRPLAIAGSLVSKYSRLYFSWLIREYLRRELELSK
jgi:hypothetical protein